MQVIVGNPDILRREDVALADEPREGGMSQQGAVPAPRVWFVQSMYDDV
jgi:hypothetical protein